ncbi:MAG: hypothetical protein CMJ41_03255 [Phycisphaerae bacterium]|nr:hypothetical protein [Phycisphaerae bacterium]|tara:strand:+ start:524 stop:877 length:354 start_codon:yes stop_codon:yes gene_type:complete
MFDFNELRDEMLFDFVSTKNTPSVYSKTHIDEYTLELQFRHSILVEYRRAALRSIRRYKQWLDAAVEQNEPISSHEHAWMKSVATDAVYLYQLAKIDFLELLQNDDENACYAMQFAA